jgi:uncharacterized protein YggE
MSDVPDPPVVAVRGEAFHEVEPEIVRFAVSTSAQARDRPEALRRLTAQVETLRGVLDGYRDAIESQETAGLHVQPEMRRSGEKIIGYSGMVATTVTVADFAVLGELLLRLADQERTTVYGPWWALRPGSPAHQRARTAAIAEAIGRAREYASALGARLTRLVELTDVGMDGRDRRLDRGMMTLAAGTAESREDEPQLDLEPQRQQVHAAVEARFLISEPTVLSDPVT